MKKQKTYNFNCRRSTRWLCILLALSAWTFVSAEDIEFDRVLASDVNADGIINILDLTFVASHFGTSPAEDQYPNPDINRDRIVNILDLTLVASYFGKYSGIPLRLTDKTFDTVVRGVKLPILVEFESDSCIYCILMRPVISKIALEYRDTFVIAKLEINRNPAKAIAYRIRGTPTYILFYKGKTVKTILGAMQETRLVKWVLDGLSTVIAPPLNEEQADSE